VFDAGADVVLLGLEDAVPMDMKDRAREMVAEVAAIRALCSLQHACALDDRSGIAHLSTYIRGCATAQSP